MHIVGAVNFTYLCIVVLYVLKAFLDTTLFYLQWPENYENLLRILLCGVIFLKLAGHRLSVSREWPLYVLTVIAFRVSWVHTDYGFILDIALLALGAVGVPYKRILKVCFWVGLYILLAALLGSLAGCIPDLVYMDDGMFKHSFGICYTTDFAAHVTFLLLTGWILYGRFTRALFIIGALGLCVYVHSYNGAKCSTVVLLLSAIGMLYVYLTGHYKERFTVVRRLTDYIDHILIYAVPICAVLMIFLTLCYHPESDSMVKLDQLLSNRLRLGRAALDKYGVTLFGTPFPQQGFGGTTTWTWALEYNFVDCSYMLILVRYGLVVLLVVCLHSVCLGRKALRHKDRRLLMAVALVAVHSMIEHHLPEIAYNFFLMLPFADYADSESREDLFQRESMRGRKLAGYIVVVCMCTAVVAVLPRFITYLTTLVDLWYLDEKENYLQFLLIASCCIMWISLLGYLASKAVGTLIRKDLPSRGVIAGLIVLLLVLGCTLLKWETVISKGRDRCQNLVAADRPIIEVLLEESSFSRLYIDYIPEIYKREFPELSDKVISAEGLALKKDTTLITEDDCELWILIAAGYEYGRLPSGHAVYTNSEGHKALLEKAGVTVTDYYYRQRNWDLQDAAGWNSLEITDTGTILLKGQGKSLLHGPGVTVYKGTLQVQYWLRLVTPLPADATAATVGISSDGGLHIWQQQDVLAPDFDENGECVYVLECGLRFNCPNVEFTLSIPDGVELEIVEIRYGKVR